MKTLTIKKHKGLNRYQNPLNCPPEYLFDIQNGYLDKENNIQQRNGYTKFNSVAMYGNATIRYLFEAIWNDGTIDVIARAGTAWWIYNSTTKTGTATSTTANKLVDTAQTFTTRDIGRRVRNTTDTTEAYITSYDSATQVGLSVDIFTSGETYVVDIGFGQLDSGRTNDAQGQAAMFNNVLYMVDGGTMRQCTSTYVVSDAVSATNITLLDNCDTLDNWVSAGYVNQISLNTSTYKQGTGAINLIKTTTAYDWVKGRKTISSTDLTGKDVYCWVYLKEYETIRDKIRQFTMLVEDSNGNFQGKYFNVPATGESGGAFYDFSATDGWTRLVFNLSAPSFSTSTIDLTKITKLELTCSTRNKTDTISAGEVIMDWWFHTPTGETPAEWIVPDSPISIGVHNHHLVVVSGLKAWISALNIGNDFTATRDALILDFTVYIPGGDRLIGFISTGENYAVFLFKKHIVIFNAPADTADWTLYRILPVGAITNYANAVYSNNLFIPGLEGINTLDTLIKVEDTGILDMTKLIAPLYRSYLDTTTEANWKYICGGVSRKLNHYYICFPSVTNTPVFVYSFDHQAVVGRYEKIAMYSFLERSDGTILFGSTGGYIYTMNSGTNDNGTAIDFRVVTPFYYLANEENYKIVRHLEVVVNLTQEVSTSFLINYLWDTKATGFDMDYSSDTNITKTLSASGLYYVKTQDVIGRGRAISFRFKHTTKDAIITIPRWSVGYILEGTK